MIDRSHATAAIIKSKIAGGENIIYLPNTAPRALAETVRMLGGIVKRYDIQTESDSDLLAGASGQTWQNDPILLALLYAAELNINVNVTFQRSKLLSLSGNYQGEYISAPVYTPIADVTGAGLHGGYNHIVYQIVGQPLGVFYLPHCTGLVQREDGTYAYQIADLDGGGINLEDGGDRYIAGQATGFSNAQMFDPSFQTQSIVLETFLSLVALVVVFTTNLHHLMFSAVIDSYHNFPFGGELPTGNMADYLSQLLNKSFILGFKIGSPFIAFTIIF